MAALLATKAPCPALRRKPCFLSLQKNQPLFLLGGFGGCTRDIAETLGLVERWAGSRPAWPGRQQFEAFSSDLSNGLSVEENATLARTRHIDQAIVLVMRGLHRLKLLKENGTITEVICDVQKRDIGGCT